VKTVDVASAGAFSSWLVKAAAGDVAVYHRGQLAQDCVADSTLRELAELVLACGTEKGDLVLFGTGPEIKPRTALGRGLGHAVQRRVREGLYEYRFIRVSMPVSLTRRGKLDITFWATSGGPR
jgi:hypothetical protein